MQKLGSIYSLHPEVRQDDEIFVTLQMIKGFPPLSCNGDRIAVIFQYIFEKIPHFLVVIND